MVKISAHLTLFNGVMVRPTPNGPNWVLNQKTLLFLLGKVDNSKYPEAETWHPESMDGWSCYSYSKISDNPFTRTQGGNLDPICAKKMLVFFA